MILDGAFQRSAVHSPSKLLLTFLLLASLWLSFYLGHPRASIHQFIALQQLTDGSCRLAGATPEWFV